MQVKSILVSLLVASVVTAYPSGDIEDRAFKLPKLPKIGGAKEAPAKIPAKEEPPTAVAPAGAKPKSSLIDKIGAASGALFGISSLASLGSEFFGSSSDSTDTTDAAAASAVPVASGVPATA